MTNQTRWARGPPTNQKVRPVPHQQTKQAQAGPTDKPESSGRGRYDEPNKVGPGPHRQTRRSGRGPTDKPEGQAGAPPTNQKVRPVPHQQTKQAQAGHKEKDVRPALTSAAANGLELTGRVG